MIQAQSAINSGEKCFSLWNADPSPAQSQFRAAVEPVGVQAGFGLFWKFIGWLFVRSPVSASGIKKTNWIIHFSSPNA